MKTSRVALIALFIALSIIGGMIKIPSPVGSIALDTLPALIAAVLIDGRTGALVAGIGHLMSALLAGFPLGPMHLFIAIEMAVIVWLFALVYQKGHPIMAGICFVICNTFIAALPMLMLFGVAYYIALLLPLFVGATVNGVFAVLFIPKLNAYFKTRIQGMLG